MLIIIIVVFSIALCFYYLFLIHNPHKFRIKGIDERICIGINDSSNRTEVNVIYNGVNHKIERRYIIKTGLFAENFELGKDFIWKGVYSQDCFSNFLKLLENSGYRDEIRNPNMICLLRDWECSEMITNIIDQVKSEFDHSIIHNGYQYRVSLRYFSSISQYFCSQIEFSNDTVVFVNDEFTEESFGLFLDCIHGIQSLPTDERLVNIFQLCMCWRCIDFLGFINTESTSFIIDALIQGNIIEQNKIEESATHHIHSLIQEPGFYSLHLSTLSRIVSRSSLCERFESLHKFIQNVLKTHGVEAFFLIFSLDFSCLNEEEVLQILVCMSNNSNSSLFFMFNTQYTQERQRNQTRERELLIQLERKKNEMDSVSEYCNIEKEENKKLRIIINEMNHNMRMKESEYQARIEELQKKVSELGQNMQELDIIKREEAGRQLLLEQEKKKNEEEYQTIGKWKKSQPSDFEGNIFSAAKEGKLTSIIFLLAHGNYVNAKDSLILISFFV